MPGLEEFETRQQMRHQREKPFVSVVLPVYNECNAIVLLIERIKQSLAPKVSRLEIVFVNDGSNDGSAILLDAMTRAHEQVRVIHFSRNYGHQAAVQAGLEQARGDAVIVMDADLQDDPAALGRFLDAWQQGYDIVYARRTERKEAAWKCFLFTGFYRVLNAISSVEIPLDAGNFSLLDREVLNRLNELPERDRYFPGLRSWVGYRQLGIEVERLARYDETPRVSLLGLFRLAKTAIFSFSNVPLTMFYLIGVVSLLVSVSLASFAMYHKLITGMAIPGWTSTTMVVSLFGAINSLGIAILGEYAARIYDQVRARPNYLVQRQSGFDEPAEPSTTTGFCREVESELEDGSPEKELLNWLARNFAKEPLDRDAPVTR